MLKPVMLKPRVALILRHCRRSWCMGIAIALLCGLAAMPSQVAAQQLGSLAPRPLPPLAHPDSPLIPARQLFGRATTPAAAPALPIGFYARGCLSGGIALPLSGLDWQVMRPSRDRFWGHPALIAFIKRFAARVVKVSDWPGILIGDMAQPRGGPMLSGHLSHQIGLDVDIWYRRMPAHRLSRRDRETMLSVNLVRPDGLGVVKSRWTANDFAVLKAAAQDQAVQRIFVNAAIKKKMCAVAHDQGAWLAKLRPMYGHKRHFHVRLLCPNGERTCEHQVSVPKGTGCSHAALAYWFSDRVLHPRPRPHVKPRHQITLADLPAKCRAVLADR